MPREQCCGSNLKLNSLPLLTIPDQFVCEYSHSGASLLLNMNLRTFLVFRQTQTFCRHPPTIA